ncbi:MAG: hypothetical protein R3B49_03390 [Phycisphaerales bacterium]
MYSRISFARNVALAACDDHAFARMNAVCASTIASTPTPMMIVASAPTRSA